LVRVNITNQTDETDLIGSMALKSTENGSETYFEYGPVVRAMRTGSVLLLDEIDLGTPRIMCLQPVLEGGGIFIKKTQEMIYPKKGFTVVGTGNTKGQGFSSSGSFNGAQVLNDALMDRFPYWIDVKHVSPEEEIKVLEKHWGKISDYKVPSVFINTMSKWATQVRNAHSVEPSSVPSLSTRRLKDALTHSHIFIERRYNDIIKDIANRFPEQHASALVRFWDDCTDQPHLTLRDEISGDVVENNSQNSVSAYRNINTKY
jgi:MoxR-like ATPase